MKEMKRILALVLCLAMIVGVLPMFALKADAAETTAPEETTAPVETTAPLDTAAVNETTVPEETTIPDETTAPDEGDDIAVIDEDTAETATGTVVFTKVVEKTVYVLTTTPEANGRYLIVNGNAAGNHVALANNNGITDADVTVQSGDVDGDGVADTYIDLANVTQILWTAGEGLTFQNQGQYLRYSNNSLSVSTQSTNWTYTSNRLKVQNQNRYLRYNNGNWTTTSNSGNATNVYFYEATVVEDVEETAVTGTIAIEGEDISAVAVAGAEHALTSTLTATPEDGSDKVTQDVSEFATYEVIADEAGIIDSIEDNVVTFTGAAGTAQVKVSYEVEFEDGTTAVVTDYITVEAKAPYYSLELHEQITDEDGNTAAGEEITANVVIKSVVAGKTYSAWPVVKYYDGIEDEDGVDGELVTDMAAIQWTSSNTAIATVDESTGLVTFTGVEGTVRITAVYQDGNYPSDTITISVSTTQYIVPEDGTSDFPEYPNEGAVRIDKNAVAVGNFSETGMAKVELSMTGVPYTAGSEVDVVIMVDMSGSMNEGTNNIADRVGPAKKATIAALKALVMNEDGTFNSNRVAVYTFSGSLNPNSNGYCNLQTFDAAKLTAMIGTENTDGTYSGGTINSWRANGGTRYDLALAQCQSVLNAAKTDGTGNNREQFVIFVTDGAPSGTFYYVNSNGERSSLTLGSGTENDIDSRDLDTYTEYYSYQMKDAGVDIYSVGVQLSSDTAPTSVQVLKGIAGTENEDGTVVNAKTAGYDKYYKSVAENVDSLTDMFMEIVSEIKQAATNVTVTDKITDAYTLVLETPNAEVAANLPEGTELTIDVLRYTLDANKNRTGEPVVIESVSISDTDKVTLDAEGNIVSINATNFTYDASTHIITWKTDKLDNTELALSYYVYLNKSVGYEGEDQISAGTYQTNAYADVVYTNHLDHQCKKEFPVPQLTWNGAQVSYTFYLVNAQGQPVNRAGRVIPFAEAIYVTPVHTESVTWDTDEDQTLSAEMIAEKLLPDVYTLYDSKTAYTINVYEDDEGKDLGNHFIIAAEELDADGNSTTKVFNTKAGTIYSAPGTYTADDVLTGFDFANTTVAFAVIWNATLAADTVVIDFGLPVTIDLTTNDTLSGVVQGITATQPQNVVADSGTTIERMTSETELELEYGTAKLEGSSVVYTPETMAFIDPEVFYYESQVEFYNSNNVLTKYYMFSTVTVIPATTIYYEDEYVTLKTIDVVYDEVVYTADSDNTITYYAMVNGGFTPIAKPVVDNTYYVAREETSTGWRKTSTVDSTVMQDQDRPGESKISEDLDADNNYGYDSAYATMSEYSLDSSAVISVDENTRGEAYFTFYGTGFDVIGLTSNTTGSLIIQVYAGSEASGTAVKTKIVDTYYGYTRNAAGEWVIEANEPNALYQVPVMKITGLDYAMYTVKITAGYNSYFDHNTEDAGYDLYLDAVRIYDPTGNQNDVANDAYVADGEGWPQYIELRNHIIAASNYTVTENEDGSVTVSGNDLEGAIFIDGGDTASIADYVSYGPNNELYLAKDQAIAFNVTINEYIADIQLGIKVGNGGPITYTINGNEFTVDTTTDMYYSILEYAKKADGTANTVTIKNTSEGILSLTNIKITYAKDPAAASAVATLYMDEEAAAAAVMSLRKAPIVEEPEVTEPEETVPETTVPEETVPETTVPEETVPETTVPEETEPETTVPEETEPEETEPSEDDVVEEVIKVVEKIVKKFFGWIFG